MTTINLFLKIIPLHIIYIGLLIHRPCYIPGTLDLVFQGMIDKLKTIEQPVHLSYKDKETLDFQLLLDKNQYTNLNSLHLWFPIRFRKLANPAANLEVALITVKNFFAHWIKETNITKYDTNRQLIRMTPPLLEVYQYSDAMLKHHSEKALKKSKSIFL